MKSLIKKMAILLFCYGCITMCTVPLVTYSSAVEASPIVEVDAYDFRINDFNRYLDADGNVRWYLHDEIDKETTDAIQESAMWRDLTSIVETCVTHGVDPSRYIHYHLDEIIRYTVTQLSKGE